MCLAIQGRILAIASQPPAGLSGEASAVSDPLWWVAEVDFGGVRQPVSLACLPEARVGDDVLVHVGVAIALVDPDAAMVQDDPGGWGETMTAAEVAVDQDGRD